MYIEYELLFKFIRYINLRRNEFVQMTYINRGTYLSIKIAVIIYVCAYN